MTTQVFDNHKTTVFDNRDEVVALYGEDFVSKFDAMPFEKSEDDFVFDNPVMDEVHDKFYCFNDDKRSMLSYNKDTKVYSLSCDAE